MNEQQVPVKKSNAVANVAWIGVVLGLLGVFLIWRGSNMDSPSTFGFVLCIVAAAFLLAALIQWYLRKE
jgi:ABC-type Mn2+/Zn2+ transport system permease subunit